MDEARERIRELGIELAYENWGSKEQCLEWIIREERCREAELDIGNEESQDEQNEDEQNEDEESGDEESGADESDI